jgi:hypothetical protein
VISQTLKDNSEMFGVLFFALRIDVGGAGGIHGTRAEGERGGR